MPFIVYRIPGVPLETEAKVKRWVAAIEKRMQAGMKDGALAVPKRVDVYLKPLERLEGATEQWGNTWSCEADGSCRIELAGLAPDKTIHETLAHEIVHYEQFRDGREFTERVVEVRAKTLMGKGKR